jgi:hypothetical protein
METAMNKIFIAAAVVASFGYVTAAEAHRDDYERNDWFATMHSVHPMNVMQHNLAQSTVEGRNSATAASTTPAPSKPHARHAHKADHHSVN